MTTPIDSAPEQSAGKLHLLVVDEDVRVRAACSEIAAELGFVVQQTSGMEAARTLLSGGSADVLLIDLGRRAEHALRLVEEATEADPDLGVLVMAAQASVPLAVESMRIGATDYIAKPFAMEDITEALERVRDGVAERRNLNGTTRRLREQLRSPKGLGNLIGSSAPMEKLFRILSKVSQSAHPVLILGESGSGKERVARAIHAHGPRAAKPFVVIDCASLAPGMIDKEIFGYARGSFPGAARDKDGLLASAHGGTVLFDEVGELPLEIQGKLLRAMEEKGVHPSGGTRLVPIDIRILASTRLDLAQLAANGRFRKDLYYRLNVVNLSIPPLRERREDIPLLAAHVLDRISRETGISHILSDQTLHAMMEYEWPGNVRELENAVERAATLCTNPVLELGDLPTQLQNFHLQSHRPPPTPAPEPHTAPAPSMLSLAELEKQAIVESLRTLKGDKLKAARMLGIGKTTLYRKLKEYGIAEPQPAGK